MLRRIEGILLLAVVCHGIFGCASGPSYASKRQEIPAVAADKGRVFFYALEYRKGDLRIDHQHVATLGRGVFFVDLPPGNHLVETVPMYMDISHAIEPASAYSTSIVVRPGDSSYFVIQDRQRTAPALSLHLATEDLVPVAVDPAQGAKEILNLPYIAVGMGSGRS